MKQTIIALIKPIDVIPLHQTLSDIEFLKEATLNGIVTTMSELSNLWNNDEILVKDWFIRVLEVECSFRLTEK